MKFKKIIFQNMLLTLFLSSCYSSGGSVAGSGSMKQNTTNNITSSLKADMDSMRPGKGYSTYMGELSEDACYNAVAVSAGKTGHVDVTTEFGASALATRMSGEVNVGISNSNPFVNINAFASYVNNQRDTELTSSVYYTATVSRKMNVSVDPSLGVFLNPLGQLVYDRLQAGELSANDFSRLCGDRLISSYNEDAAFIIKLNFRFATAEENARFKAEFKTKTLFTTTSTKLENETDLAKYSGKVEISADQFGGLPEQLPSIAGGSGMLTCDLKNLYTCDAIITQLLSYGSQFSSQFMNMGDMVYKEGINMMPSGQITLAAGFSSYVSVPAPSLESDVVEIRNKIINDRKMLKITQYLVGTVLDYPLKETVPNQYGGPEITYNYTRSSAIAAYLPYFKQKIDTLVNQYYADGQSNSLSECWTNPANCKAIYEEYSHLSNGIKGYLVSDSARTNWGVVYLNFNDPTDISIQNPVFGQKQQLWFTFLPSYNDTANLVQSLSMMVGSIPVATNMDFIPLQEGQSNANIPGDILNSFQQHYSYTGGRANGIKLYDITEYANIISSDKNFSY